jgi:predicted enzyme related to lactoylglutathione lyase
MSDKGRILGVGGVFMKCEDPDKVKDWYGEKLGFNTNQYGCLFEFRSSLQDKPEYLQWSTFKQDSDYFTPSEKQVMINYRVDDLDAFLEKLKAQGIDPVGEVMRESYGNFAHIMDPEGNKIELWEMIDPDFSEMAAGETHK